MIYRLNKEDVPTIPVPHDCIIKEVRIEQDFLTLLFEDNLSEHDSIGYIWPQAKSLIIRIHLTDGFNTYKMKDFGTRRCKSTYVLIDNESLKKKAKKRGLAYLYHYVGYQSIIIHLFCKTDIILHVDADYIEYEWIM